MKLSFSLSLCAAFLLPLTVSRADPAILSFTPNFASSNDPGNITIKGTGFYPHGGTLVVRFNGAQDLTATATTADGTTIIAHVPTAAPLGVGPISVSVNNHITYSAADFTVIGPGPYVTGFSPIGGSGGASVQIFGAHFSAPGTISVKFNGLNASSVVTNAPGLITVTAPNGVSSGPISVGKTGLPTYTTISNFFVPPVIKSFSPVRGRVGTNVIILGTNFLGATAVKFGSIFATNFSIDSNFQITAMVPSNAVTGVIRVNNPVGSWTTTSNFLVQPTIFGFTPGFGLPGTPVTITGANLDATPVSVTFNGVSASIGVPAFSSLTATAPASTTGPIVVTTGGGSSTSSVSFYYPPIITGFTPTNSGALTTVKISGTNFTDASAVSFNGQSALSFVVTNNNTIGAVVPIDVITGPISVTTPGGTSNSVGLFYGAPLITGFTPSQGAPGAVVTLTGTNFLGTLAVLFNGTSAAFTVTNNNLIGARVPTNASSGPITLIAPGGTNTTAGSFTMVLTSDLNVGVVDSPDPVFVGSNLVYTITVANTGPDNALNVMLTNTLPASVSLKSASASQGTLNTNANPIIGTLGAINKNAVATVTLTVVPQTSGYITNVATIGSDNIDPTLPDHISTISTLVWPLPFLSIQSLTSNQIKVFWPAPLSNFTLLTKSNLIPSISWSTDLTARVISGTNISVTETNSGEIKFFRLKQ